jgi:hypothetical protein
MPTPQDVIGALKYASDNFDDPDANKQRKAQIVANKLGMGVMELKQLRFAMHSPDDERSTPIKNKIFDRVAETQPAMEIKKGGGLLPTERFTVKNLIDEDIGLQKEYLDKKGYQTRDVGGVLEVKKPGDMAFQPIDPAGIDRFDMFDIVGDTIKGIAEGIGQGSKALGAGIGGPLGFGIGTAVSGGLSGATETARQAVGIAAGVRPEFNVPLIGKEAATGAVLGGALKGAGMALKGFGTAAADAAKARMGLRPESEAIKSGMQAIGGEATPAQLLADKNLRELEDALLRSKTNFFPTTRKLKAAYAENLTAANQTAREVMEKASQDSFGVGIEGIGTGITKAQKSADSAAVQILNSIQGAKNAGAGKLEPVVGAEIKESIGKKIGDKLAKSTELYDKVESSLNRGVLKPNMADMKSVIAKLKSNVDDASNAWLDKIDDLANRTKTMNDLSSVRSIIINDTSEALSSGNKQIPRLAKELREAAESTRDGTFSQAIMSRVNSLKGAKDPKNAKEIARLNGLHNDLLTANKLYREVNVDLDSIAKRPGESDFGSSARTKLDELMKEKPEKVFANIAATNDADKAKWMIDNFPDEFKKTAEERIGKIRLEVMGKDKPTSDIILSELNKLSDSEKLVLLGKSANDKIGTLADLNNKTKDKIALGTFLQKVYNESSVVQDRTKQFADAMIQKIKALPKEEKEAIFGADAMGKINGLQVYDKFKLDLVNPSKSALNWGLFTKGEWANIKDEFKQVRAYKNNVLNASNVGNTRKDVGNILLSPVTRGSLGSLIPDQQSTTEQSLIP